MLCNDEIIYVPTLIDTGDTEFAFIDQNFALPHNLELYWLKKPYYLEVIDRRPIQSGAVTYLAYLKFTINDHKKKSPICVTTPENYLIVLGIS